MSDIEANVEADIALAVAAYERADKEYWTVGEIAARYLGQYQNGVIQAIADRAKRDKSTIENHAHAWELWQRCGANPQLRDCLTITHFARAWAKQRKYGLTDAITLMYLWDAARYGYSGSQMDAEIEAHEGDAGTPPTLAYYLPRVKSLVESLKTIWDDLSDDWRDWLKAAPKDL